MSHSLDTAEGRFSILMLHEGYIDITSMVQQSDRFYYRIYGNFYCKNVFSLDQLANINSFVDTLSKTGIDSALKSIQGGAFSMVISDCQKCETYLIVDRYGIVPVFYQIQTNSSGSRLEFSFYLDNWDDLPKDPNSIYEFLSYGALLFSDSFNDNLIRVKGGQYHVISSTGVSRIVRWWERGEEKDYNVSDGQSNLVDIIDEVDEAFCSFFKKVPSNSGAIAGLSGGFDSRLILGYLQRFNVQPIHAVTMGNKGTDEVSSAKKIAQSLGIRQDISAVPHDLLACYGEFIASSFHLVASLEAAHVGFLCSLVKESLLPITNASYFDGFLGDVVMGGTYFSEASRSPTAIFKDLVFTEFKLTNLQSFETYIKISLNSKQRSDSINIPDSILEITALEALRERVSIQIAPLYETAKSHEEMLNLMRLTQRGYRYISNGPKALFSLLPTYLPFMDHNVRDSLDKIPLNILARQIFYRAFLREKFPNLASIPKAYNGSSANSSEFFYRFSQYISGFKRHIVYPKVYSLTSGKIDLNQEYIKLENYFQNKNNIQWMEMIIQDKCPVIDLSAFQKLRPISKLRLISLVLANYL
jgi:hypothetical protein